MAPAPNHPHVRLPTWLWHCDPNFITCSPRPEGGEHMLRYLDDKWRARHRIRVGHSFFQCRRCVPPTYFFVVFSPQPSPIATCYAIDKSSYEEWDNDGDETFSTAEMLYLLRDPAGVSWNPSYRPARERKG